jgi:hypothetical protein
VSQQALEAGAFAPSGPGSVAIELYYHALACPAATPTTRSLARLNLIQVLAVLVGGTEAALALLSSGGNSGTATGASNSGGNGGGGGDASGPWDDEPVPWVRQRLLQLDILAHRQVVMWAGFEDRETLALSSLREWLQSTRTPMLSTFELLTSRAASSLVTW